MVNAVGFQQAWFEMLVRPHPIRWLALTLRNALFAGSDRGSEH
jgi:hypothetical protein